MAVAATTLLVVDHDPIGRRRLAAELQRQGHQVVAVEDGRRALQALAIQAVDLVVLDVGSPGGDGLQTLERMQAVLRTRHTVVLVAVAPHDQEPITRSLALGALDYLAKPVDPLQLRARVGAALRTKLLLDAQAEHTRLRQQSQFTAAMIGKVTHELRSPFAAADFSLQLLHRYAERGMQAELQQQIEVLKRQLAEGRRMIDGVIGFATFVGKRTELRRQQTDIGTLVAETVKPLSRFARARRVTLEQAIAPDLPPARVDAEQLAEAIGHLVHNAIKFNREGGRAVVTCHAASGQFTVAVEDTGVGVEPDKLGALWEPFAQTGDDLRRGVEGLGLGLALVRSVVEAHGGEVTAQSTPGAGSVFGFRIPYQ